MMPSLLSVREIALYETQELRRIQRPILSPLKYLIWTYLQENLTTLNECCILLSQKDLSSMFEGVLHTSLIVNLQSLSKKMIFNVLKYVNTIKILQVHRLLTDEYWRILTSHARVMHAICVREVFLWDKGDSLQMIIFVHLYYF